MWHSDWSWICPSKSSYQWNWDWLTIRQRIFGRYGRVVVVKKIPQISMKFNFCQKYPSQDVWGVIRQWWWSNRVPKYFYFAKKNPSWIRQRMFRRYTPVVVVKKIPRLFTLSWTLSCTFLQPHTDIWTMNYQSVDIVGLFEQGWCIKKAWLVDC